MVHEFRNGFTLNLCDNDGRELMRRVAKKSTKINIGTHEVKSMDVPHL